MLCGFSFIDSGTAGGSSIAVCPLKTSTFSAKNQHHHDVRADEVCTQYIPSMQSVRSKMYLVRTKFVPKRRSMYSVCTKFILSMSKDVLSMY